MRTLFPHLFFAYLMVTSYPAGFLKSSVGSAPTERFGILTGVGLPRGVGALSLITTVEPTGTL